MNDEQASSLVEYEGLENTDEEEMERKERKGNKIGLRLKASGGAKVHLLYVVQNRMKDGVIMKKMRPSGLGKGSEWILFLLAA